MEEGEEEGGRGIREGGREERERWEGREGGKEGDTTSQNRHSALDQDPDWKWWTRLVLTESTISSP